MIRAALTYAVLLPEPLFPTRGKEQTPAGIPPGTPDRRPENAIGWIFCLLGVSLGAAFSAQFYADYSLIVRPGSLPGGDIAIWSLSWTAPVLSAAPTFVLLLFPDGRLLSRRWRPVAWLAVGAAAMSVVGLAARELVRELGLVRVSSRWRSFERPGRAEWERSER